MEIKINCIRLKSKERTFTFTFNADQRYDIAVRWDRAADLRLRVRWRTTDRRHRQRSCLYASTDATFRCINATLKIVCFICLTMCIPWICLEHPNHWIKPTTFDWSFIASLLSWLRSLFSFEWPTYRCILVMIASKQNSKVFAFHFHPLLRLHQCRKFRSKLHGERSKNISTLVRAHKRSLCWRYGHMAHLIGDERRQVEFFQSLETSLSTMRREIRNSEIGPISEWQSRKRASRGCWDDCHLQRMKFTGQSHHVFAREHEAAQMFINAHNERSINHNLKDCSLISWEFASLSSYPHGAMLRVCACVYARWNISEIPPSNYVCRE